MKNIYKARAVRKGWTLIELIMVMVLLGIVSVVAFINISSYRTQHLYAAAERIANDLRYVKNLALTTSKWHGVSFTSSTYTLYETDGVIDTTLKSLISPAQGYVVNLGTDYHGVSISALVNLAGAKVEFSPLGVPYTDKNGFALVSTAQIVLSGTGASGGCASCGGTAFLSVYIDPQTGRIYIQ